MCTRVLKCVHVQIFLYIDAGVNMLAILANRSPSCVLSCETSLVKPELADSAGSARLPVSTSQVLGFQVAHHTCPAFVWVLGI